MRAMRRYNVPDHRLGSLSRIRERGGIVHERIAEYGDRRVETLGKGLEIVSALGYER